MSNYIFDMPHGGELVADPPTWAWGSDFMTASPEAVAICRDNGFRELSAEAVDFERTTHRKFYVKGEPPGTTAITEAHSTARSTRGSARTSSWRPATWCSSSVRTPRKSRASDSAMFQSDARRSLVCAFDSR